MSDVKPNDPTPWQSRGTGVRFVTEGELGDRVYSPRPVFDSPAVPGGPWTQLQRDLYAETNASGWSQGNTFAEEIAHLHEEVSEAFREWRLRRDFTIRFDSEGKPTGVAIEFADVLIGMFYNAEREGFDLFEALAVKRAWNRTRDYRAEGRQLHD